MIKLVLYTLFLIFDLFVLYVIFGQAPTRWQANKTKKTPEDRFANLPDFPFAPNYKEVLGYQAHYLDEGPKSGPAVLLLHGQPSWSFLYRKMIPPLTKAGFRVIVPDLIGFGKSDKPLQTADHNYQMHIDTMTELVKQLDLKNAVFFGQDWGGLIGLRVVANEPDRFSSIVLSNTGLPFADGLKGWLGYPLFKLAVWREGKPDTVVGKNGFRFTRWVAWAATTPHFDLNTLFQNATSSQLSDAELAAYNAPFPDESYMSAIRKFPSMVPSQLRQNAAVMRYVFEHWQKPFITAFSDSDPVTKGMDSVWQRKVPGAKGQPHRVIAGGNHFIQEDNPMELVDAIKQAAQAAQSH